jgi:hypothetical protein
MPLCCQLLQTTLSPSFHTLLPNSTASFSKPLRSNLRERLHSSFQAVLDGNALLQRWKANRFPLLRRCETWRFVLLVQTLVQNPDLLILVYSPCNLSCFVLGNVSITILLNGQRRAKGGNVELSFPLHPYEDFS